MAREYDYFSSGVKAELLQRSSLQSCSLVRQLTSLRI